MMVEVTFNMSCLFLSLRIFSIGSIMLPANIILPIAIFMSDCILNTVFVNLGNVKISVSIIYYASQYLGNFAVVCL